MHIKIFCFIFTGLKNEDTRVFFSLLVSLDGECFSFNNEKLANFFSSDWIARSIGNIGDKMSSSPSSDVTTWKTSKLSVTLLLGFLKKFFQLIWKGPTWCIFYVWVKISLGAGWPPPPPFFSGQIAWSGRVRSLKELCISSWQTGTNEGCQVSGFLPLFEKETEKRLDQS